MIKIVFPDLSEREFEKGITPLEIANSISLSLAKSVWWPNLMMKLLI